VVAVVKKVMSTGLYKSGGITESNVCQLLEEICSA
jgi:hypothetical protein